MEPLVEFMQYGKAGDCCTDACAAVPIFTLQRKNAFAETECKVQIVHFAGLTYTNRCSIIQMRSVRVPQYLFTASEVVYVQCFSRSDIEKLAEQAISQYKHACVPEKCMCYNVDIRELASLQGYYIDFRHITKDASVLGRTTTGPMFIEILDEQFQQMWYYMDGHTILVEKRLTYSPQNLGRINFTIAHELAHQIINRTYPEVYGAQDRVLSDFRRSVYPRQTAKNWYEWQADALAAALLMPKDAVVDSMFMFGLGDRMKVLSRRYSPAKYERFCYLAEHLQVSRTALAYRMEQLGLLERNLLVKEARERKGVA